MAHKKGQLSFDFYTALIVFLGFLGYIVFQLFQITPVSLDNLEEERIRLEAYQISELLINDPGHPIDWETRGIADPRVYNLIGLSDPVKNLTNYLSRAKVNALAGICGTVDAYYYFRQKLAIADEISVTFIEHTPAIDITWTCGPPTISSKRNPFNVSRTFSIDGTSYGELIVEVWRI